MKPWSSSPASHLTSSCLDLWLHFLSLHSPAEFSHIAPSDHFTLPPKVKCYIHVQAPTAPYSSPWSERDSTAHACNEPLAEIIPACTPSTLPAQVCKLQTLNQLICELLYPHSTSVTAITVLGSISYVFAPGLHSQQQRDGRTGVMEIHHPRPADGLSPDTWMLPEEAKCEQYFRALHPCLSPISLALLLSQSTVQWDREGEEQQHTECLKWKKAM